MTRIPFLIKTIQDLARWLLFYACKPSECASVKDLLRNVRCLHNMSAYRVASHIKFSVVCVKLLLCWFYFSIFWNPETKASVWVLYPVCTEYVTTFSSFQNPPSTGFQTVSFQIKIDPRSVLWHNIDTLQKVREQLFTYHIDIDIDIINFVSSLREIRCICERLRFRLIISCIADENQHVRWK